ncbi:Adenylate cyclase [Diplonema papillatum]|nr:Adenylate cyclase [Diplonema papillatum]
MKNAIEVWVDKLTRGVVLPSDDEVTVLRKLVLLPVLAVLIVGQAVILAINIRLFPRFYAVPVVEGTIIALAAFCYIVITRSLTQNVLLVILAGITLTLMHTDLITMVNNASERAWPAAILIIDLLLVCKVDDGYAMVFIGIIIVWLFLTSLESFLRFGLLDLVADESHYRHLKESVDCEEPPCKEPAETTLAFFGFAFIVFYCDFYITRGFSRKVLAEKCRIQTAVETANTVARALADFDIDAAEVGLESSTGLPEGLALAFRDIIVNLKSYRPFLPESLFDELSDRKGHRYSIRPVQPPGIVTGKACVVFTDIVSSTTTWESCPDGMKKGLKLHNCIMRTCAASFQGYEVKTIGDSFMVAFETLEDGVNFGLSVHVALLDATWPPSLLELQQCRKDPEGMWGGLKVRIGAHCGSVEVELNNVTGRVDYFGSTVNKAARLEGACTGGFVAVDEDILRDVRGVSVPSPRYSKAIPSPAHTDITHEDSPFTFLLPHSLTLRGPVSLRGVQEPCSLALLVPESLKIRRAHCFSNTVTSPLQRAAAPQPPAPAHPFRGSAQNVISSPVLGPTPAVIVGGRRGSSALSNDSMLNLSASGDRDHPAGAAAAPHEVLRDRLEMNRVTVARVLIDTGKGDDTQCVEDLNDHLSRVLHCLDRSEGSVFSVIGSSVAAGWNASRRCSTHFESCLRFTGMLYKTLPTPKPEQTVSLGVADGAAFCGALGNGSQRFVTVVGPCVALSGHLAFAAQALQVFAVYASSTLEQLFATHRGSLQQYFRPLERWGSTDQYQATVVYQLDGLGLTRADFTHLASSDSDVADDPRPSWGWSQAYWQTWEDDLEDVKRLAVGSGDVCLYKMTALRMRGSTLQPFTAAATACNDP